MEVVLGYGMGRNPASVDLDNNIVRINADLFAQYTPEQRRLVLLHEAGHVFFDSLDDEALADRFALEVLAGREPNSLRKSVQALTDVLSACGVSADRLSSIVRSALQIDYEKFGNQAAKDLLDESEHRTANFAISSGVAAIISAVVAVCTSVTETTIDQLSKTGIWFQSGDKAGRQKNALRVQIVEQCTQLVCSQIAEKYCINGLADILARLDNKSSIYSKVHAALLYYIIDKNVFNKTWKDQTEFYDSGNCGWAKDVIDEQLELQRKWIIFQFEKAGLTSSSSDTSLLFPLALVFAVLIFIILI